MDSVMFDLGILKIKWYSFFIFIAMITACFLIIKEARKKEGPEEYIENLLFYGIIIGVLGARLYYVIFNLGYYLKNPLEIFMLWEGGLAIHGGIIATFIFLILYSKKKKINVLLMMDIIAVGLIIAQAIGRWGNFFNHEAYGRVISLAALQKLPLPQFIIEGMRINGYYREPTFLYESILSLLGFIILLVIRRNKKLKVGQLSGIYLLWYGLERLFIEYFRSDSLMLGPIKVAQLVSIIFIGLGIYLIVKKNKKLYNKETLINRR